MMLPVTLGASAVLLAAAAVDIAQRRIPNELVIALAMIGIARLGVSLAAGESGLSVATDVAACLGVFVLGLWAFHLKLLGGGDVKLLAAAALVLGAGGLVPFLLATSVAGGALALGFLIRHRAMGAEGRAASLPYGVAIAAGGLYAALGAL